MKSNTVTGAFHGFGRHDQMVASCRPITSGFAAAASSASRVTLWSKSVAATWSHIDCMAAAACRGATRVRHPCRRPGRGCGAMTLTLPGWVIGGDRTQRRYRRGQSSGSGRSVRSASAAELAIPSRCAHVSPMARTVSEQAPRSRPDRPDPPTPVRPHPPTPAAHTGRSTPTHTRASTRAHTGRSTRTPTGASTRTNRASGASRSVDPFWFGTLEATQGAWIMGAGRAAGSPRPLGAFTGRARAVRSPHSTTGGRHARTPVLGRFGVTRARGGGGSPVHCGHVAHSVAGPDLYGGLGRLDHGGLRHQVAVRRPTPPTPGPPAPRLR